MHFLTQYPTFAARNQSALSLGISYPEEKCMHFVGDGIILREESFVSIFPNYAATQLATSLWREGCTKHLEIKTV